MLKFIKKVLSKSREISDVSQPMERAELKTEICKEKEKEVPAQDELLSSPLLSRLRNFDVVILKKGTVLYHGSREKSYFTELDSRSLTGSRKWVTEDKVYAVNYAFCDLHSDLGKPLLWKLELTEDVKCLHGSQFKLMPFSPWGSSFPFKFPDNFSKYADELLGNQKSQVLLDHFENDMFTEVLVTNHTNVLKVLDVCELPDDKAVAISFAENMDKNG
ncbi:hypothetical protein ABMY01_23325 [Vibrio vulnificus]|uniref:hypothetical protein n=1 Tax=Vibrio vulnificus TaxID=672 RepID=UPI004057FC05